MKSTVQFSPDTHLENISKMFKKLYKDEQLADVTLCCKDGTIRAHKLILATSSPYFHKIFTENNRDHPILIMHGISYQILHDLIELIYNGNVEVPPEAINPLYELAGEFELAGISGILRDEDKCGDNNNLHIETRYKGLKRVAVDFKEVEKQEPTTPETINSDIVQTEIEIEETPISPSVFNSEVMKSPNEKQTSSSTSSENSPKLSAWAKKQRKFKCDLCPSSFKRSSHLTRHQLVHTGERPFACDQCDKAFSRHDKLKHHIRKTHELDFENDFNLEMQPSMVTSSPPSPTLPFVISHVRTETIDDTLSSNPPKRPRGRPRKYPLNEKPPIKRGRGRPRLTNSKPGGNGENYDITNLPYGDLEYLTMPLQDSGMMEPYVEIKTEKDENTEGQTGDEKKKDKEETDENSKNLKDFENRIATIGECTISVANH